MRNEFKGLRTQVIELEEKIKHLKNEIVGKKKELVVITAHFDVEYHALEAMANSFLVVY